MTESVDVDKDVPDKTFRFALVGCMDRLKRSKLVTQPLAITGPSGAGKSALLLQFVHRVAEEVMHEVWFSSL